MRVIKEITDFIREELADAEKYADYSYKSKAKGNMEVSQTASNIASQELQHAMDWHNVAVDLIKKIENNLKTENKEVPIFMLEYWNDIHEEYLKKYSQINYILNSMK